MLIDVYKQQHVEAGQIYFYILKIKEMNFFQLSDCNETCWIKNDESKQTFIHHSKSQRVKNKPPPIRKIMVQFSGTIRVLKEFLEFRVPVNADAYCKTLLKLKLVIQRKRHEMECLTMHTSHCSIECSLYWEILMECFVPKAHTSHQVTITCPILIALAVISALRK